MSKLEGSERVELELRVAYFSAGKIVLEVS